jgi:hypothetical protein
VDAATCSVCGGDASDTATDLCAGCHSLTTVCPSVGSGELPHYGVTSKHWTRSHKRGGRSTARAQANSQTVRKRKEAADA